MSINFLPLALVLQMFSIYEASGSHVSGVPLLIDLRDEFQIERVVKELLVAHQNDDFSHVSMRTERTLDQLILFCKINGITAMTPISFGEDSISVAELEALLDHVRKKKPEQARPVATLELVAA